MTRFRSGLIHLGTLTLIAASPLTLVAFVEPDPKPEEIIKDLEKKKTPPPPPPPSTPSPATPSPIIDTVTMTEQTVGTRLLREGTFLTSRRGRMGRASASEWVFTFDADARGKADPAMVLMPCMNLQNMERVVERNGDGVTFTISGQVFVYKGRNYLLPTMYVLNRRPDVAPAQ